MGFVGTRIGERSHFLVEPWGAAARFELFLQTLVDVPQVGHVGERVGQLLLQQRPARPVGEARGLVEIAAGDLLDQVDVAHRLAEAAHHGGDLRIEDRVRDQLGLRPDDLEVLAGGMKHFHHRLVGHQLVERLQVDAGSEGIDNRLMVGTGNLDQAQLRPEGLLANELRVDRHEIVLGELSADLGQILGGSDKTHGRGVIAQALGVVAANACRDGRSRQLHG